MVRILIAALSIASPVAGASDTPGDTLAPGEGLGLAEVHQAPVDTSPAPRQPRLPNVPLPAAGAIGLAGTLRPIVASSRRRRDSGPDTLFVYVPGHGGSLHGFADLATRMGVDTDDVRVFDYRWAFPSSDRIDASRWAPADDAADALGAYLAAQGEYHQRIYVVGHSKGGAVVAELIARWDEQPAIAPKSVTGAALLDAPIADGALGDLQSYGHAIGHVPDDGHYDPIKCSWFRCTDTRVNLGRMAGVEVIAIRNPDAVLTNFTKKPEGLRVYDLMADGGPNAGRLLPDPFDFMTRVGEAHSSVLHHDAVADCISAEASLPGSCEWQGNPTPAWSKPWGTSSRLSIR